MPLGLLLQGAIVPRTAIGKGAVRTAPKRELELFLFRACPYRAYGAEIPAACRFLRNRTENRTKNRTEGFLLEVAFLSVSITPPSVRLFVCFGVTVRHQ